MKKKENNKTSNLVTKTMNSTPENTVENITKNVENVLDSNRESVEKVYHILEQTLNNSSDKGEFYELCKTVCQDCKKALEKENLTKKEIDDILDREMKVIEKASEIEQDKQKNEMEIAKLAIEKDSENKKFLWAVLGTAVTATLSIIGGIALGGNSKK